MTVMKRFKCLTAFSIISAPKLSETTVEFMTDISSADFSYAKGDTEQRKNIEESRLHYWEKIGIVVAYVAPSNVVTLSISADQVYTEEDLRGHADDLLRRKVVVAYVDPPKPVETKTESKPKIKKKKTP